MVITTVIRDIMVIIRVITVIVVSIWVPDEVNMVISRVTRDIMVITGYYGYNSDY